MATTLPGSPPAFDKNDVAGTVRALCAYTRVLQENLDFTLGQIQKSLQEVQSGISAAQSSINTVQSGINAVASGYAALEARVAALERKNT